MTIRVAVIEVSHWHSTHDACYLAHLMRMPDVRIVGLQDPDPTVAAARAADTGNPPTFSDYKQMLRETKPDFVLALGRHSVMAETAHYLLDGGHPFLMEKPMGVNAEEVLSIAEKAEAKRAFVAAPIPRRYVPYVKRTQAMIAEGVFGPLSHISVRVIKATAERYRDWDCAWMLDPKTAAGGCLRNLGAHCFDLFTMLAGEEAEVIGAQISNRVLGLPVEDYALVTLRSISGVIGTIEVGYNFPGKGREDEFRISGRNAVILVRDGTVRIATADGETSEPARSPEKPHFLILRDALDRWQRGEAPLTGVRDFYRIAKLTDEAYRVAMQS